ncbi:MAG: ABC transporter permease [Acidobacteria bacterium]|nr:ABC transporter permease [Acidobacteriota bacterium]MYJ04932.1 ABC transporter permease [Acidobacteriota bacterium]
MQRRTARGVEVAMPLSCSESFAVPTESKPPPGWKNAWPVSAALKQKSGEPCNPPPVCYDFFRNRHAETAADAQHNDGPYDKPRAFLGEESAVSESPWWRIGWRNLGRNRKRTALTALGLAIGYFAVVLMIGWGEGMVAELIENSTSLVSGQIEIHDAGYRPERSLYDTIGGRDGADVEELLNTIGADPSVVAAAPRVYAGALLSSGDSTRAGVLLGVDPEREVALTRFLDPLVAGRLPAPGAYEVVVGEEMARQLAIGVGDELVVVASAADGSMANDLYGVTGVFRTGLIEFDGSTAVMPIGDLQILVAFDAGRVHEIAVSTIDPAGAAVTAGRLADAIGAPDREIAVAAWNELNPVLSQYVALADGVYWIFIVVIFGVACLGVANTMLMATFERRREFAIMLALGAKPWSVVGAVLSEALALGFLSLAIGAVLALPLMVWFSVAPVSLEGLFQDVTLEGALVTPTLRVGPNVPLWTWATIGLLVSAVVAAFYPAVRTSRVPPADTLSGL